MVWVTMGELVNVINKGKHLILLCWFNLAWNQTKSIKTDFLIAFLGVKLTEDQFLMSYQNKFIECNSEKVHKTFLKRETFNLKKFLVY